MAKEHTMDITVNFDFQELKNAVEQTKKEALNRYDLKDADVEIELKDESIEVTAQSEMQIESIYGILIKKMIGRNVSPKILDRQPVKQVGGLREKQEIKLIKALDQENAKNLSKMIRDQFPKAKPVIQGDTLRVSSTSIDELQTIIKTLQSNESIKVPLHFGNFR